MTEDKFPEIGSRFVPKDAPPKGAEVREVTKNLKKSDGYVTDAVSSKPVKNIQNPSTNFIPLSDFNKNYKLI
ncbi:hypothetical protein C4577_02110 [Candidatus Parcubacteria bacterium]|nr:MAG: hypothetical protein C4577_02110 [Candidatus Parcubacteria bacterium]